MKASTKSICWIGPKELRPQIQSFFPVLLKAGYHSSWVDFAEPEKMTQLGWVGKYLHENASGLVWLGFWKDGLEKWLPFLREQAGLVLSNVPVFWGYGEKDRVFILEVVESSVDDIFSLSDEPEVLIGRFLLSQRLQGAKAVVQHKIRIQAKDVARNETIIKQREEFLGVCAHDLRSPLGLIRTSISMVLNQAAEKSNLEPVQTELLSRAKKQASHALNLVNDLLDVMAYEQGLKPMYQLIHLHDFLMDLCKDFGFHAEQKNIRILYENPVQDWSILADSDRIRQLFQNLFVNALKFSEQGKNIYMTVMPFRGRRKTDPPYPMVIISLRDEGKGIPPREMQKIFDRFSQIKEYSRSEGRGLGLTVAKQISTLHDGNIWVQSVEGKGSTFFVLFPHVISKPLEQTEPRQQKKVLVAEASLDKRETFFDRIQDWGYEVVYVKDGPGAIATTYYDPPDLLILGDDLMKMEPDKVVELLKADSKTMLVPVVLVSGACHQVGEKLNDSLFDALMPLSFDQQVFQKLIALIENRENRNPKFPVKAA